MKFGTFVLGGLAGAAVVMLMKSKTMTAVRFGMSQMWKHQMNTWKENAIEKGLNVKFGAGMMQAATSKGSMHTAGSDKRFDAAESGTEGLKQVEQLASEINHILHENSH